ncbi:MAG TPA: riboflavin synthase [Kiritimatiellia bacterium]|nr:riboflavin synthase [Kiritimatiellia bacterium]HQQ05119.1 riboflavin synthase [Kiritimatiellia bacterium]
MFSGIVQKKGEIVQHDLAEKWGKVVLRTDAWDRPLEIGESIAIQGICLTLTKMDHQGLHFDVLRETFERTNLGDKKTGQFLNMERSLRWGDTMGGHIVIGHVDGTGRVKSIRPVGRDWAFEFTAEPRLMDGMVFKGSVSVDGVSLTIAELTEESFTIHIIPFTYEHTTFCDLKPGDAVNLEVDLLGKFVRRLVERGRFPGEITWEELRRTGLIQEPVSAAEEI